MKNLYQELESVLTNNSKTFDSIVWVGTSEYTIPKTSFLNAIKSIYYDPNVGVIEIASDLIVVGDGWMINRHCESSGVENWNFVEIPATPKTERTDIVNYCIRDYVNESGFRILNMATSLNDLNPEPDPEPA